MLLYTGKARYSLVLQLNRIGILRSDSPTIVRNLNVDSGALRKTSMRAISNQRGRSDLFTDNTHSFTNHESASRVSQTALFPVSKAN
eukprot:PDM82300.1 hypothetical protein PRIPAC_36693 [Pristionchus pacificus]